MDLATFAIVVSSSSHDVSNLTLFDTSAPFGSF